jgi:hypothetical protein
MNPVAQGLAIHAAQLRCLGSSVPVQNKRQRQHSTRGGGVPRLGRRTTKTGRIQIGPSDRNPNRHLAPPRINPKQSESRKQSRRNP